MPAASGGGTNSTLVNGSTLAHAAPALIGAALHASKQHHEQLHNDVAHRQAALHELNQQHDGRQLQEDDDDKPLNPILAILLIYGVLFLMIAAQAALVLWRKRHARSYDLVTLVGLWLMPPMFCIQLHFWRFLTVWTLYSGITLYLLSLCMSKKIENTTPRMVYSWFLATYRVSVFVGVVGYMMLLAEFMGMGPLFNLFLPRATSLDLVWYGVYFGVLGRDCAEVASDRIATSIGSAGRRIMNTANACGICGQEMHDFSHMGEERPENVEPCVQLSCKHSFHNLCVRGWTMVGKKDTCPQCNEKVDLRTLYADRPWETRNLTWIQMLDTVRYLVVWNPIILMALSVVLHFLPHPHHHHHHPPGGPLPPGVLQLGAAGGLHHPPGPALAVAHH